MLRRTLAFLCLASLGGLSDQAIRSAWFHNQAPRLVGRVGENLSAASTSPDSRYVAGLRHLGGEKWTITVWETVSGREVLAARNVPHPPGTTNPLAWSPDSQVLAVGSAGEVNLWEVARGTSRHLNAEWLVRDVRFSGNWLMARCDNAVFVWDWKSSRLIRRQPQDHLLAAAFSQDQKVLAVAALQDSVRLYSLPQGKLLRTLPAGPATVSLDFVNQDKGLATAFRFRTDRSQDYAVVYDWQSGRERTGRLSEPDLVGFSVSADGSRLLTRNPQGGHIWDGSDGRSLLNFKMPGLVTDSLSSDGQWVASLTGQTPQVVVWKSDGTGSPQPLPQSRAPYRFSFYQSGMLQVLDGACSVWKID